MLLCPPPQHHTVSHTTERLSVPGARERLDPPLPWPLVPSTQLSLLLGLCFAPGPWQSITANDKVLLYNLKEPMPLKTISFPLG